jgi:hypothetical protein
MGMATLTRGVDPPSEVATLDVATGSITASIPSRR